MTIDVLYCDFDKIDLFNAQRTGNGARRSNSQSTTHKKEKSTSIEGGVSGGIPLVAMAKTKSDASTSYKKEKIIENTFDPKWTDAIEFLNEGHMIIDNQNAELPPLGSIRIINGSLSISDLGMVKRLMSIKSLSKIIRGGESQGNRKQRGSKPKQNNEMDMVFDILAEMPHSIQASIISGSMSFWCTLKKEHLIVPPDEVFLKYGREVAGQWCIAGLIDAHPEYKIIEMPQEADFMRNGLGEMIDLFAPAVRQLLGRPINAFGITPIMIYRKTSL